MRPLLGVVICLLLAVFAVGCAENEDNAAPTTSARTTPEELLSTVWERAYSECASEPKKDLAGKYRVDQTTAAVSAAVAAAWRERFGAGEDALASGVDGCLQGMKSR